jgi:hypothetical protein
VRGGFGGLLRAGRDGSKEKEGCQRESCIGHAANLRTCFVTVLPDGPAKRGAATSLRAEAFGWALPLVAREMSLPTNGRATRSRKKACERPLHA